LFHNNSTEVHFDALLVEGESRVLKKRKYIIPEYKLFFVKCVSYVSPVWKKNGKPYHRAEYNWHTLVSSMYVTGTKKEIGNYTCIGVTQGFHYFVDQMEFFYGELNVEGEVHVF